MKRRLLAFYQACKLHRLGTIIAICILSTLGLIYHHSQHTATQAKITKKQPLPTTTHPLTAQARISTRIRELLDLAHPSERPWQKKHVAAGDSLSSILQKGKLSAQQIYRISQQAAAKRMLKMLRNKQLYYIQTDHNGYLTALRYRLSPTETLYLERKLPGPAYTSYIKTNLVKITTGFIAGSINGSLGHSIQAQGGTPQLTHQLQKIFNWKINFNRDLHPGDQFAMLYDRRTLNKKTIANGPITIAELMIRNKPHIAIYFQHKKTAGYYSPDYRSWEAQFLRAPLHYRRISSPFTHRRWQPILKVWRPHYGTDFAAPVGTPIVASANGVITHIAYSKSYGNIIYIQHNLAFSTRYAHLEKFAKGLHKHSRVTKGQTIGYLGQTGYTTGPHLHYEVRKYGIPQNPMTVRLPNAAPVPRKQRPAFKQYAAQQIQTLRKQLQHAAAKKPKLAAHKQHTDNPYQQLIQGLLEHEKA